MTVIGLAGCFGPSREELAWQWRFRQQGFLPGTTTFVGLPDAEERAWFARYGLVVPEEGLVWVLPARRWVPDQPLVPAEQQWSIADW